MSEQALELDDVSVEFRQGRRRLRAVSGVSLRLERRRTLAVVGESGSGKSTLARGMTGLVPLSGGTVRVLGKEFRRPRREQRRHIQLVFQDPCSSLDPSATIRNSLAEPLVVHERLSKKDSERRVAELLRDVGLPADAAERYPHEFSGGQRQRVAIARAIATKPDVLVLDEAVSALDVSTQNQILELLGQLQREHGLAYVFISHNLGVVRWIADETVVMYLGHVVETGPAERVHVAPAHPYTQALVSAMPVADPTARRGRRGPLTGEPPDQTEAHRGCVFAGRCPIADETCHTTPPPLVAIAGGGTAACHQVTGSADIHEGGTP
ncbi:ABC transporter ATP-binding protein [Amycolatopsis acidicola]|uniref:ABC transporter ATP-binding protein n=1 Tax=Amycolatopsis acidicola TaxID=2596893 RepID=A0A5N0UTZ9_9PSEU|nr:ABC transporter ATP-binding protein [Amycolatopsis acidicola]KAA9153452.1 ABC transporter ATP-binding protein [Amycolatopsis acidicola]